MAARRAPARLGARVDWVLAVFCAAMLASMWRYIGATTIPYHFMFLAIGLVYGFRVWPLRPTVGVIAVLSLATGAIFLRAYSAELIEVDELSEILLMPLLLMGMIWHARRRDDAMRRAQEVAAVNADLLVRQHESLRDTAHAIRSPTAIARGFVDLALACTDDPDVGDSLAVAARQLDRTALLSSRLLTLAALDAVGIERLELVQLSQTVRRVGAGWTGRGPRDWRITADPQAWLLAEESAVETAIDALLENALNHTREGDVIRMSCRVEGAEVLLQVADSGPGVPPDERDLVFQRFWHTTAPNSCVGSGLGLSMVDAVARAHGGSVSVATAVEGGAEFTVRFPRTPTPQPILAPVSAEPRQEQPQARAWESGTISA